MALRIPWIKLCAEQIECFKADNTVRPTLPRLIEEMEAPGRAGGPSAHMTVPAHMIGEGPVTFRTWATNAPRKCDDCGLDKNSGCCVITPKLDEECAARVQCDVCANTHGDLWLDKTPDRGLVVGEAGVDWACREHDDMLNSFRALMELYK